jgi:DNA-binding transcriptional regulator YiaG
VAIRAIRGGELKAFRRSHGYTQVKFAHLLRVSVDTLVAWECDRQSPRGAHRSLLQVVTQQPESLDILLGGRPSLRPKKTP